MSQPEVWLRGPVEGIDPWLMPVAHALLGAREDMEAAAADLTPAELWARPGGAASVGFHVRHAGGSLDRLFTYARGEALAPEQLRALKWEGEAGDPPVEAETLLRGFGEAVERALAQLRATPADGLLEFRGVGRLELPSNVLGLLFHAAEHTQRHVGQVVSTAKIVRGIGGGGG
ncbi:MAG TPA: DinB family protein [Longimicrobium sp.]|nr:DinB family protein [Longimicrobium sp.]